jgi:mono/diheme cytochrome c family protein/glucose/arabinose dehydrogenase
VRVVILVFLLAASVSAQRGDRRGREQPPLPKSLKVPPAPVLSPKDGLRSLRVQPGFEVQLVAAEPLVEDPVCITFDENGRIWAVEMRGFMPNVDGTGELKPSGRIVVLTDTDDDGVMDRSDVFLDKLVLPRLVSIVNQGVLVLEPPNLYLCRDTDGDLKCDEKTIIRGKLGGRSGPEHAINGGMVALDNWIQFAKFGERLRFLDGKWVWRKQLHRGQWGITQDDFGRAFHNGNSDHLRGDRFPPHYAVRGGGRRSVPGANMQVARDQSTWPIRITPGINRGYQKHMLRDYKLARFTAACSPVIYRDTVFPKDCRGNAFVCEPSGNFVRRTKLVETPESIVGRNAYEKDEFLASTDERFRPVDLKIGPDGGLYVVDMYRGILQHKVYVTTFLRRQIIERGLDKPVGLGRIYRVMPKGAKRRAGPALSKASDAELIATLEHDGGFWRDNAQRLLIKRGRSVAKAVEKMARESHNPLARLHALWVLEGIGALTPELLRGSLSDKHHQVRCAALRLSEPFLSKSALLLAGVQLQAFHSDPRVVLQTVLTLGELDPPDLVFLARFAVAGEHGSRVRGALVSAVGGGRELQFLEALCAMKEFRNNRGGQDLVNDLSRSISRALETDRLSKLIGLACSLPASREWVRQRVLQGVAGELARESKKKKRDRVLALAAEPKSLVAVAARDEIAARVVKHLAWPGRPMQSAARKLTRAQRRRIGKGKMHYTLRCFACHAMNGKGQPGVAPSLVGSKWVLGNPERLIPILIHGLTGPITVDGKEWNLLMPAVPDMKDEEIALILSYVRNSFGHEASLIDTKTVRSVRKAHAKRDLQPFTVEELAKIK